MEQLKLGLGENRAFDAADEFGKRADVYTDGFPAGGDGFDQGGAPADMGIEHEVAGLGERLDRGARKNRRKSGRIFVKAVRQSADGRRVARTGDERAWRRQISMGSRGYWIRAWLSINLGYS